MHTVQGSGACDAGGPTTPPLPPSAANIVCYVDPRHPTVAERSERHERLHAAAACANEDLPTAAPTMPSFVAAGTAATTTTTTTDLPLSPPKSPRQRKRKRRTAAEVAADKAAKEEARAEARKAKAEAKADKVAQAKATTVKAKQNKTKVAELKELKALSPVEEFTFPDEITFPTVGTLCRNDGDPETMLRALPEETCMDFVGKLKEGDGCAILESCDDTVGGFTFFKVKDFERACAPVGWVKSSYINVVAGRRRRARACAPTAAAMQTLYNEDVNDLLGADTDSYGGSGSGSGSGSSRGGGGSNGSDGGDSNASDKPYRQPNTWQPSEIDDDESEADCPDGQTDF